MRYALYGLPFILVFPLNVPKVNAGLSPSEYVIADDNPEGKENLQESQRLLESKIVGDKLRSLGFTESEIEKRLGKLSDAQLHYVAQNLDQLRAGGGLIGLAIAIPIALVLILLAVLL